MPARKIAFKGSSHKALQNWMEFSLNKMNLSFACLPQSYKNDQERQAKDNKLICVIYCLFSILRNKDTYTWFSLSPTYKFKSAHL